MAIGMLHWRVMKEIAPNKNQLQKYLDQGMSHNQIAMAWERDTGIKVARSTISMAISRHGLKSANEKPRYPDLLPWTIRSEHMMATEARLLRLESRSRAGSPLSPGERRRLARFLANLDARHAVIDYIPQTKRGFLWATRLSSDDDIIRRPKT